MPINSITYNTLVELIKNYIKTNCINISNYAELPSCFKPGWSQYQKIASSGDAYTSSCTFSIANSVPQVSTSVVDSDITSFLNSINITDLSLDCTENNYITFINDITTFCATKLSFTISQFSTSSYLVYNLSNDIITKINISQEDTERLTYASDMNSLLNSLVTILKRTIRAVPCTYNISVN